MEIKITSSNIRFDNPQDGDHAWSYRRNSLAKVLLANAPHIIGSQEGREPQLRDLETLLGTYKLVDSHRAWLKQRMYPCFYIDPSYLEIIESGDIWLSESPNLRGSSSFDSLFPRLATWIKAKIKSSNKIIWGANLHLDHLKESTRIEQIKVFNFEFQKLISQGPAPFFVQGDFNEGPNKSIRMLIQQTFPQLQDPWEKLKYAEESSYHRLHQPGTEEFKGERIDWILLTDDFEIIEMIIDKTHNQKLYPSDHWPVKFTGKLVT